MLTWSEVRRLIVASTRDALASRGFNNPGVSTWRFRQDFIDVIEFRSPRQGILAVEFGCDLRDWCRQNPKPHHCGFRVHPAYAFDWPSTVSFSFQNSIEEQLCQLNRLRHHLLLAVETWFVHFATVDSALASLQNNVFGTQNEVTMCSTGSVAFQELERRLMRARTGLKVRPNGESASS